MKCMPMICMSYMSDFVEIAIHDVGDHYQQIIIILNDIKKLHYIILVRWWKKQNNRKMPGTMHNYNVIPLNWAVSTGK